jgi:hypothetical protein
MSGHHGHGDGAHTHGGGDAGGLLMLAVPVIAVAFAAWVIAKYFLEIMIALGVVLVAGAVAAWFVRRYFTSDTRYYAHVRSPGTHRVLSAEQQASVDAAHQQQLLAGPQVHINIGPGTSPETAAAAIRAMKDQAARTTQPISRAVEGEDWQ